MGRLDFGDPYPLIIVVLGLAILGVATLVRNLNSRFLTFPMVVLAASVAVFAAPIGLPHVQPGEHGTWILHVSEIGVIVSLMGVGLKIDRKPAWSTWATTIRLLAVAMPLSIAAVAGAGWALAGLGAASAVLLGATIAPTDPVLASDIQVGEPLDGVDEGSSDAHEEELPFALTSEAGLNDALAFPFTYLAILMVGEQGGASAWFGEWLLFDWAYRLVVGTAIGVAGGWLLARVLLSLPTNDARDRLLTGSGALAGTLLLYGVTEVAQGYGFLAVFVGALAMRRFEHSHETHRDLHVFAEQTEQLLLAVILVGLGSAIAGGLFAALTPMAVVVAVLAIVVIRPVAGWLSLLGSTRLGTFDKGIVACFGIKGLGSIFYLAYAVEKADFDDAPLLWAIVGLIITMSIVVHGASAKSVLARRR